MWKILFSLTKNIDYNTPIRGIISGTSTNYLHPCVFIETQMALIGLGYRNI